MNYKRCNKCGCFIGKEHQCKTIWNKDKPLSSWMSLKGNKIRKIKISKFMQGNTFGFKLGQKPWNKDLHIDLLKGKDRKVIGKKISRRLKGRKFNLKQRESFRHYWESKRGQRRKEWEKEKIKSTWNLPKYRDIAKKRRMMQILPLKDSKIEIKIQNFLKELQIEFFTHQYIHIEHGYQCDILIPSMNLVIECDGDYWHKYPIRREIDHIRTKELIQNGFKVLRLWEREIKEMNIGEFKEKLNEIYR